MAYTLKQRQVLEFIADHVARTGVAPTLDELAERLSVSRVTAHQHLHALERRGAIARRPREARAIEILDPEFLPARGVPILGSIAAGSPIEAIEAPEPFTAEDFFPADGEHYLLRVRGDSMIDDHIADGDLVLVERRHDARDGDTVVAIVQGDGGEEATLKRFYREPGGFRLEPRNPRLAPLRTKHLEIRGIVRGVLRRY